MSADSTSKTVWLRAEDTIINLNSSSNSNSNAHLGDHVSREHFGRHVGEGSVGARLHARYNSQIARQTKIGHLGAELVPIVRHAAQQHVACAQQRCKVRKQMLVTRQNDQLSQRYDQQHTACTLHTAWQQYGCGFVETGKQRKRCGHCKMHCSGYSFLRERCGECGSCLCPGAADQVQLTAIAGVV